MNSNSFKKKPVVIQAFTFEEVIAYGRENASNVTNGIPWSFTFRGHSLTHERDDCYLVSTLEGIDRLTPNDVLIIGERGEVYPFSKEIFEETYESASTPQVPQVEDASEVPVVELPERVIDMLYQDAGVSTYHPDGDQQEKMYVFARNVVAETIARLPSVESVKEAPKPAQELTADYWDGYYKILMQILEPLRETTEIMVALLGLDEEDASEGVLVAAEALIAADRAQALTDDYINALDCAIKIQRGVFEVPTPIGYQVSR